MSGQQKKEVGGESSLSNQSSGSQGQAAENNSQPMTGARDTVDQPQPSTSAAGTQGVSSGHLVQFTAKVTFVHEDSSSDSDEDIDVEVDPEIIAHQLEPVVEEDVEDNNQQNNVQGKN